MHTSNLLLGKCEKRRVECSFLFLVSCHPQLVRGGTYRETWSAVPFKQFMVATLQSRTWKLRDVCEGGLRADDTTGISDSGMHCDHMLSKYCEVLVYARHNVISLNVDAVIDTGFRYLPQLPGRSVSLLSVPAGHEQLVPHIASRYNFRLGSRAFPLPPSAMKSGTIVGAQGDVAGKITQRRCT